MKKWELLSIKIFLPGKVTLKIDLEKYLLSTVFGEVIKIILGHVSLKI